MSQEITKVGQGVELTDAKRKEILRDAKNLLAEGIAMGHRRILQFSASLHNVKAFQAYRADGFTSWKAYCEANDIDRENSYKYLDIAKGLLATIPDVDPDKPFLFTKQYLDAIHRDSSAYFRTLGFKELHAVLSHFDAHAHALNSKEIYRLLPPPKEEAQETEPVAKPKSDLAEFNEHMRKVLAPFGYVWNAKERRCEHQDGTPLTDDEIAQITHPDTALRMWHRVEREAQAAVKKIEQTALLEMKNFMRYKKAIPNRALEAEVMRVRNDLANQFNAIVHMLDAVIDCDEERVREIKKYGLEEA